MKENSRLKIVVACHKYDPDIRRDGIYFPVQVGKALHPDIDLGFQGDDTGDNISAKNGSFNELSAIYWAWKNLKDADYVGLCHYRRYFDASEEKIMKELEKGKIVLPDLFHNAYSTFTNFVLWTSLEEMHILIDSILNLFPDYRRTITEYFLNDNRTSICNMFIMSRSQFDAYCEFLFSVLFEIEKRIKTNPYARQRRVLGYLAEPLLMLWIRHNKYPYATFPLDNLSLNKPRTPIWVDNMLKDMAFKLGTHPFAKVRDIKAWDAVKVGFRQDGIELKQL